MNYQIIDIHVCSQCKKTVYGKKIMLVYPQWSMQHFCSEKCKQKYIIENKVKDESNLWSSEFETYKTTNKNRKETLHV